VGHDKKIACVVTSVFVTYHIPIAYLLTMQTSWEIAPCRQASSYRREAAWRWIWRHQNFSKLQ